MGNIGKREKIILGIMAIFVLYGLFTLMYGMTGKKKDGISSTAKANEIRTIAADANNLMGKDALSASEIHAISRIEAEWSKDPFYERKAYNEMLQTAKTAKEEEKVNFSYTGYLEHGSRQIAIINGMEYGVGETLGPLGYVLRSITPTKVTIEDKMNSKVKFEVVIQDS